MLDSVMYTNGEKNLIADGVNSKYMGKVEVRFGSKRQTARKPHISSNYYYTKKI